MKSSSHLFLALLFASATSFVRGEVVEGPIVRGPTGNFYQVILNFGITWDSAKFEAESRFHGQSGHLATITSAGEHQFVLSLASAFNLPFPSEVWLGGFQQSGGEEPGGGWTWLNGEGFFPGSNVGPEYTFWSIGEPNNAGGEQYLAMAPYGDGGWNDEGNLSLIKGYVVEYESEDCAGSVVELAFFVASLNLVNGISNALDAKLDAALGAIEDLNTNNDQAACNSLSAFINHVNAQRGSKISHEDADLLVEMAQAIQACIGC